MNSGLVTSFVLILGFFYISGAGFTVVLLSSRWWRGFWSVILFPILGIILSLIFAAILIPRGVSIENILALVLCSSSSILFFSFLKSVLSKTFNFQKFKLSSIDKREYLLTGSLIVTALLPIFFITNGAVMNVRLGIDAALYADGAQSILAHENQPTLVTISTLHPGSLSTALFFQHFRWGSAFLMALSTLITSESHSLAIGIPLFSVVLFLIAGLVVRILTFKRDIRVPVLFLAIALTAGNTFFVRLLTEGQWPNLVAILLIIFLIYVTVDQYSRFEDTSTLVRLNITSVVTCCAILITYAEILPLMAAIVLFTHIIASFVYRKVHFLSSLLLNTLPFFFATYLFFALSNPAQITYFKFLILPSYANVGYPTPRSIFPTDFLGITDLWGNASNWLSPAESVKRLSSPDLVGLSIINILFVFLIILTVWNPIKLLIQHDGKSKSKSKQDLQFHERRRDIFSSLSIAALGALLIYSWLSSQFVQKSDYLLIKASSILLIPILICIMSLISPKIPKAQSRPSAFLVGISMFITLTIFTNVQNLVQLKSYSTPLFAGNLVKTWDQKSSSECIYLFDKRGGGNAALRWADRTTDYYMESVFRSDVILDPWTNQSLARPVDIKSLENQNICLALRVKQTDRYEGLRFKEIFRDESWLVLQTQMTYREIVEKFGVLENFQTSILD
jgi:hypothetical protein